MQLTKFTLKIVFAFVMIASFAEAKTTVKVAHKKVVSVAKPSRATASVHPTPPADKRIPAGAGMVDSNAALEVRGQSRNLSMMLVIKNKKDDIDFVKPRDSYSREVQNTNY